MKTAYNLGRLTPSSRCVAYKCPECGEVFIMVCEKSRWSYRNRHDRALLCSWHCLREYEKTHQAKRENVYFDYLS